MSDIEIIRGNNYPPAQWQFLTSTNPDVIFPLEDSVFKLTIEWTSATAARATPRATTQIALSSDVDAQLTVDLETSILAWSYSIEDSRELPVGRAARYEIERWFEGTQQTLVRAYLVVSEGLNPD